MASNEMRVSNPQPGQSPDLGLWAELLDERDIEEIIEIKRKNDENRG